jgi:hypothetical protein
MVRFQERRAKATSEFEKANKEREELIWKRSDAIVAIKTEVDAYNNSILELAKSYASGEPKSVV